MANSPDISAYSFPHLDDTSFPLLDNVDVYKYENNFDYERWSDDTKIHLCNVLWNNDYSNVVKFKDDAERDAYFDNLSGYQVDLQSAFNIAPDGYIKVPIPYQVATRYNYLYVDLPIMTSEEEPINYENLRRTKRYYYFINSVIQGSPSATTLVVSPDNWTTYINNVQIPYMMLKRGHAPMAAISVENYLANPIANNRYLLAPDYDFANGDDVVKSAKFVPINNGTKYILFATTMSQAQINAQTYPAAITNPNTPATFANDSSLRYGYQYIVNGYQWGIGGYNFNGMVTNTTTYQSANDIIPNGMTMVAVKATNAATLFAYMAEHIPFFFKTIKACFMVDDTMFTLGTSYTFCNVTCYTVLPAADSILSAIKLAKSDFNYDTKYDKITKLYTSPYAQIEVTDNNGNTKKFKIENSSNLQVHKASVIAFPYISIQAYISGVNGSGSSTYTWKKLSGTDDLRTIYSDDFGEYLWQFDVPTYALYVRGYDDFKATNYPSQNIARYNAVMDYKKTVGVDNTQYENAKDAANNTQTMTNNTAATENTNAVNQANTINTNNIASADTARTNHNASADTAQTNTNNQAQALVDNNATNIARNTENMTYHTASQVKQTIASNGLNQANQAWDAGLTRALTKIENTQNAVNGVANAISTIGGSSASQASMIGSGNFLGALGAVQQGALDLAAAGISTYVGIVANSETAENVISNTQSKVEEVNTNNTNVQNIAVLEQNDILQENNVADTKITKTTTDMMKTNADNTNTTERGNALRTYATSASNANRQLTVSVENANRTKSNSNTNAKLNRDVTVANADYTRDIGVLNAQITLEQKRQANQQQYYTAQLSAPTQFGSDTGDPTLDAFERKGLQVKVRTQSAGNIAQAGDLMLRFGYSLNQVWNVTDSGLNLMKHFTYWEAADIWINEGEGVNQDAQSDIQSAFERGVTVWANPNEIGKVSIYDNWK